MPSSRLQKAFDEASRQRNELVGKLVSFVVCDSLLFVPKETPDCLCEQIQKAVKEANLVLNTRFTITDKIDVPVFNLEQEREFLKYIDSCCDDKVAYIYLAATELRSVLTAILLAERKIDFFAAFNLAFYEEISQQNKWGLTEDAEKRQCDIKNGLEELERVGYERGLFKD